MKRDKINEEAEDHVIDFENDYEPLRIGLKQDKLMIVINYQTPSNLKVYHHFIKLSKYINS
jgi:frataxin-like iron-binding protein CyaY